MAATIAGLDESEAGFGFAASDASVIRDGVRQMRSVAASVGIARVAAEARLQWRDGARIDASARERRGAVLLAAWLRTASAVDRAKWVRALDAETLRAVQAAMTSALPRCDARALAAIVSRAAEALGRLPAAIEAGGLLDAVHGDDRAVDPALAALARFDRITASSWRAATSAFVDGATS